jgi:hypothetical protein
LIRHVPRFQKIGNKLGKNWKKIGKEIGKKLDILIKQTFMTKAGLSKDFVFRIFRKMAPKKLKKLKKKYLIFDTIWLQFG